MNVYAPASSLGWLDLDAAASARVGTLLRSLEEPGTLDVLGLGSVRDAFSDMLSPGTSTIQTRLRYFIFLPWIFRGLETQQVSPADLVRRLREDEARLIDCLRHLGPNRGVIGYTAGRDLKRMPSAAYWSGLRAWDIRRLDLSLAEYAQRAAAIGRPEPERDNDGNTMERAVSMWAPIPPPPEDFLHADITFELHPDEAQVLVERIRQRHPNTLLAVLSGTPGVRVDVDYPWNRPRRPGSSPARSPPGVRVDVDYPWNLPTNGMPDRLVAVLRHARCFSELTAGPQHVYNMLLARKARKELRWDTHELEASQRDRLDDWAQLINDRHGELCAWVEDLPEFWRILAGHGVSASTQDFVNAVVKSAVDYPAGFADDPVIHEHIRNREIRLKSKRARLAHRAALETWNQAPVGGQLNYRWPTTKIYLADLAAAGPAV